MNYTKKELRSKASPLLARIQRKLDSETKKSPFVPSPEKQFLTALKEELEKSPGVPRRTKLSLFDNSRDKGR